MRILIFILFLSFGHVYSQTIFFVRPTIDYKIYVGTADHTLGGKLKIFNNKTASNPYFQTYNHLLSTRAAIHLGINFGLTINNKHTFEFVWGQDEAGSSWETRFITLDTTFGYQSFIDNSTHIKSYIGYQKFALNYQYQISSNNDKTSFGLSFGTGVLFNPYVKKNTPPKYIVAGSYSSPEYTMYLDKNISMPIQETRIMAASRFGGFLSFGVYSDVRIKKKYILSASLTYLQGFKFMESSIHHYHIEDKGVYKRFSYDSASRGSGLYLHLSRKIQFYPWKKKSKQE